MPCSHRRHWQDKTVSSRRRCELSWWQLPTVFSSPQYTGDWTLNSFVQCRLRCECICELVLTQFPNRTFSTGGRYQYYARKKTAVTDRTASHITIFTSARVWHQLRHRSSCKLETGSGQDKTQFTPHFETGQSCFEIFSRRQSWLVDNSVHTVDADKTRQSCVVSSVN